MTPEVRLFAGMSAFGVGAAIVYWFLTYDSTGTVLLGLFGVAAGIAGIGARVGSRGRRRDGPPRAESAARPSTPTVAEPTLQPVPRPGWAPLGMALGLGGVALGAAFGPAIAVAGILVTLGSARSWLGAAVREADDARRPEGSPIAPDRSTDRPVTSADRTADGPPGTI